VKIKFHGITYANYKMNTRSVGQRGATGDSQAGQGGVKGAERMPEHQWVKRVNHFKH